MKELISMIKKEAKALNYEVELEYDGDDFLSVTFVIPRKDRTPFRVGYNREENLTHALNFLRYCQKAKAPTPTATPKLAKWRSKDKNQERLF